MARIGLKRKLNNAGNPVKKRRRRPIIDVTVVDAHDDSMLPFIAGVKAGDLPKSGNKLFHYDSHPDLGNPEAADPIFQRIAKGKVPAKKLHDLVDIATWITPLVLAGWLDEVIWCCGSWCDQIKEGRYELLVGLDAKNQMKCAAFKGKNADNHAIENYWAMDGTALMRSRLKHPKKWVLHVVKYDKAGQLSEKKVKKIESILNGSSWALDIDEDFFSCNNPYRDQFEVSFGKKNWDMIRKIYDIGDPYDKSLKTIMKKELWRHTESEYMKHKHVQTVIEGLKESEQDVNLVKAFRKFLGVYYSQEGVYELINYDDLHDGGVLSSLPHHYTRVDVMNRMGQTTESLLRRLDPPRHATVATSRLDRYLPDCHATIVHEMTMDLLEKVYRATIIRKDKPEFSIA